MPNNRKITEFSQIKTFNFYTVIIPILPPHPHSFKKHINMGTLVLISKASSGPLLLPFLSRYSKIPQSGSSLVLLACLAIVFSTATLPPRAPNKVIFASSFLMAQILCKKARHSRLLFCSPANHKHSLVFERKQDHLQLG